MLNLLVRFRAITENEKAMVVENAAAENIANAMPQLL